ncbi:MAG: hypothetical protein A2W22_00190 [Candidatus Levybacteria bacterium RBG_16_35_11]|nr:MAG: hypothetical protein A2W22_00190 [Candidatus Levybacteria bacterium RBG_16_35_11]
MDKNNIKIQVERLKRHLSQAKNGDAVAFLDLAHGLRVISEQKGLIDNLIRDNQLLVEWPNINKNNKIKKILKGSKYFEIPLVSKRENPQQGVQIKDLCIINRALSAEEIKELYLAGPLKEKSTNLTFSQWLNSEVLYTTDDDNRRIGITREILIKRTANLLGGSHPENESVLTEEKFFDAYIKELHSMRVAGDYPVIYYQLIEIAEIIVERIDRILL